MFFQHVEAKFSLLDSIPESLYTELVTHSHGELLKRIKAILHWRLCMLDGRLPEMDELDWPEKLIKKTILMRLESLDIAKYCYQQETLTDNILIDILQGIANAEDYFSIKADGFVDKLAQRQTINDKNSCFDDEEGLSDHINKPSTESTSSNNLRQSPDKPQPHPGQLINQQYNENSAAPYVQAKTLETETKLKTSYQTDDFISSDQAYFVDAQLDKNWQELAQSWHTLSDVYQEFSGFLAQGWDLTQGVLSAEGWRDIIRYRTLLKQLPELKSLIASLGRLPDSIGEDKLKKLTEQVYEPVIQPSPQQQQIWSDRSAMETGGIILSDDLSRLLPSELALLGHPKLKMLWYAKRAERKLLTYCHCGLIPDQQLIDQEKDRSEHKQSQQSNQTQGPIIICLDTSGSMQGMAEKLAKALVLEGLRIAFNEHRPCYIYAFGGQQQILQHQLDLTQGGLIKLLKFLQQSFNSGTDVVQPLLLAIEKQKSADWKNADILLLSDGRFPIQKPFFNEINKLKKKQGLRIHGVLLGNWKNSAMTELCEPLHNCSKWLTTITDSDG